MHRNKEETRTMQKCCPLSKNRVVFFPFMPKTLTFLLELSPRLNKSLSLGEKKRMKTPQNEELLLHKLEHHKTEHFNYHVKCSKLKIKK